MGPEKLSDAGSGQRWAERLSQVESRNVTFLESLPPFWTRASGGAVMDASEMTYLDFSGAFGVALAGHRHGLIVDRIREQAGRLVHGMGDIHPPAIKLVFLEALARLLPWRSSRTILGLSGSDAVEAAIKTAHLATGRPGIIAFEGSYHGLTLGALAATDREHFRRPFTARLADHVRFVPFPSSPAEAERVLDQVSDLLAGNAPVPVGAVIVEPIQGRAGVRIPPSGFLAELGNRTRAGGALLVADEIFTGMGRTGSLFACEHDGFVPDLICLGKALGGGMPLSACCGPREVMDAWPPSTGEAIHTGTFLGHPLSCAGGLGFLAVLEADDLAGRARRLGDFALGYLEAELDGCDRVAEVRGRGLMLGVELRRHKGSAPGAEAAARALESGLIVLPAGEGGEVVELTPPATLTRKQLESGLQVLVGAIRSAG